MDSRRWLGSRFVNRAPTKNGDPIGIHPARMTLPPDTIAEILEILLEGEGTSAEKETVRSYPKGVPLPSLSGSPAAQIPLLAAGWRELLNKLTGRQKET